MIVWSCLATITGLVSLFGRRPDNEAFEDMRRATDSYASAYAWTTLTRKGYDLNGFDELLPMWKVAAAVLRG